jgi:hypothetical protein
MATSDGAPAVSVVLRDRLKLFVNGVEVHRWADPYGAGSLYIYISISKENGNFRVGYKHTRTGSYTYTEYMPLPAPFNTLDHVLMRYSTPGLSQGEDRFASFFIDQIVIRDYK